MSTGAPPNAPKRPTVGTQIPEEPTTRRITWPAERHASRLPAGRAPSGVATARCSSYQEARTPVGVSSRVLLAAKTASSHGATIRVVLAHLEVKVMDSMRGRLAALVGVDVSVRLVDGTRPNDCQLVSFSRRVDTAWFLHSDADVFVTIDAITDVWEVAQAVRPSSRAA